MVARGQLLAAHPRMSPDGKGGHLQPMPSGRYRHAILAVITSKTDVAVYAGVGVRGVAGVGNTAALPGVEVGNNDAAAQPPGACGAVNGYCTVACWHIALATEAKLS